MPIDQFDDFYESDDLVIIVFGVLTGLTYSSVSPRAGLAVATSLLLLVKTQCYIQLLDSLFY